MKIKIFMDSNANRVETQVNEFLGQLGKGQVIKTETLLAPVAEKPNDGTFPCIVVSIWYDDVSN